MRHHHQQNTNQRNFNEFDRDDHSFDTPRDREDSQFAQRRSFGGYNDNNRAYEDAREYNGGRVSEGGSVGQSEWAGRAQPQTFRGQRDDRPVMGSRYGYDDDRRFGPSGHAPQRFDHDHDDGRWGRDHDNYHHEPSFARGYEAAMREMHRRDPRRDDPQAGRSAFEQPFRARRR